MDLASTKEGSYYIYLLYQYKLSLIYNNETVCPQYNVIPVTMQTLVQCQYPQKLRCWETIGPVIQTYACILSHPLTIISYCSFLLLTLMLVAQASDSI